MPGPLLTVVISGSARRGFWEGPALVLGHAVAEALIVVALAAGLSRLLKRNLVAGLIGLLGGAFLLWMGFDIVRSAWWGTVSLEQATGAEAGLQLGPIITGIVSASLILIGCSGGPQWAPVTWPSLWGEVPWVLAPSISATSYPT